MFTLQNFKRSEVDMNLTHYLLTKENIKVRQLVSRTRLKFYLGLRLIKVMSCIIS